MSLQNFVLKKFLRHKYKPRFTADMDLAQARLELDSIISNFMPPPCKTLNIESVTIADINCERVTSNRRSGKGTFLYLHGGMFCMGSPKSHQGVTFELAKELGLQLIVPNYRLAPEHPFPAAPDDACAVYHALLKEVDPAEPFYIGGDQAGATLAMLLALRLRDEGAPLPDLIVGLSGLFDLTLSSASHQLNEDSDCCNTPDVFNRGTEHFLADPDLAASAETSPLLADLAGLPPVMLQFSSTEMLRDDSRRLAAAIKAAGGKVSVDEWNDVPSCWHLAAVGLPEGRSAIRRIGRYMNRLQR